MFRRTVVKVEAIKEDESTIVQLIEIFDIKKTEKDIKEDIYSLEFWEERKIELAEWHKKDLEIKNIIADYHNGYDVLTTKIQENREDMPFLKTAAKEIFDKYLDIFRINFEFFFDRFHQNAPLIIYAILMNENLRKFFLEDEVLKDLLQKKYTLSSLSQAETTLYLFFEVFNNKEDESYDKNVVVGNIQERIKLHVFKGKTEGYWKDLEITETKVMILSIPNGTYIRSADKPKEELSSVDVNGNFLILNGLMYKSNTEQQQIVYIEV